MNLRPALPTLAAICLALPPAAQAATLSPDRPCYGPGEQIALAGAGFTPGGQFALSTEGRQLGTGTADAAGGFRVGVTAPTLGSGERTDDFTATDQANLALTATIAVRLTALSVGVEPKRGDPGRLRRIKARGFTTGRVLYAHVRKGRQKRNIRIGRLKGACRALSAKKRIFSSNAKVGTYKVQFDTRRKYSAKTTPQVYFLVTVYRTVRPANASGAGAGTGERWVRAR